MFVTDRDLGILKMCLEQKFMTLFQISRMFFPESRNVFQVPMKRVRTLVKADLLKAVTARYEHLGESMKRLYASRKFENFLIGSAFCDTDPQAYPKNIEEPDKGFNREII